jgi:hypothetical protein
MWRTNRREVAVSKAKISGDRLVLALISAFRTLVFELSRRGLIDRHEFIAMLQETAITHRVHGDPNNLAAAIDAISVHLQSMPDPKEPLICG